MKLFMKLGMVLGVLFILVACQKEELALPTEAAIDQTSTEVFSGDQTTESGASPWGVVNNEDSQLPGTVRESTTAWSPPPESTHFDIAVEDRISNNPDDNLEANPQPLEAMLSDRWEENVTIEWVDEMPTGDQWIFVDPSARGRADWAPDPACPYEDCDTAIPATIAHYQSIANQQCQDIWVCIPCCMDDGIVYATLVIRHNCGIVNIVTAKE